MARPADLDRERLINAFRTSSGVPAVGAATVATDGVEWLAVIGERVRGRGRPVQAEDRWHLGSCTKAVTAAHYALLVDAGFARWESTVPDLFAELPSGVIHRAWEHVTIEQVLTHRAGLARDRPSTAFEAARYDTRPLVEQRIDATAAALARPPDRVGTFSYSNLGYVIAGATIEQITGKPWEVSVIADLLMPLGITSAGFGPRSVISPGVVPPARADGGPTSASRSTRERLRVPTLRPTTHP